MRFHCDGSGHVFDKAACPAGEFRALDRDENCGACLSSSEIDESYAGVAGRLVAEKRWLVKDMASRSDARDRKSVV